MKIPPILIIIASILIITSFSGCISSYGAECDTVKPGVLTIGITPILPPLQYYEEGELKGYDIDLMKEIANKMGLEPEFKVYSYKGAEEALLNGEIDCIPSTTVSPERKERMEFSRAYLQTYMIVAVFENSPYTELKDLNGKKIAVFKDTYSEDWSYSYLGSIDAELISYESIDKLMSDIYSGNLDAVVTDQIHMDYYSEQNNFESRMISEKMTIVYWAVALKKDNGLQDRINDALFELEQDEALYELKNKWYD
ncbi:amino acid ABC transporter substrate-binding protein, PAAT family [Methanococcus maripaludis C5]|uniref:Amino acid ABC transporter substrate-binding protein, PAAT family n=1 Tax=Methanococcus maripaludis (strain C5 / ATCC BAA-1333) TaxID=402880 RepID=A4FWV3_METM5|nr:ABC transporter substrate-binding protein [Methanococcus maripaludis]ABO34682.1 amino acid ABC transporter substrate-binding protein, PAAT family [Methanococcus maripaludis C5]